MPEFAKLPAIGDLATMIQILRAPLRRAELQQIALASFGDLVKAVVDVERALMAIDGELHADEECTLLEDGSRQQDLWGINLYPSASGREMIEFDSMINIRPARGNRSRTVEDEAIRKRIEAVVARLVIE